MVNFAYTVQTLKDISKWKETEMLPKQSNFCINFFVILILFSNKNGTTRGCYIQSKTKIYFVTVKHDNHNHNGCKQSILKTKFIITGL